MYRDRAGYGRIRVRGTPFKRWRPLADACRSALIRWSGTIKGSSYMNGARSRRRVG